MEIASIFYGRLNFKVKIENYRILIREDIQTGMNERWYIMQSAKVTNLMRIREGNNFRVTKVH